MTKLERARLIINEVDKEMLDLFIKRMDAAKMVGEYKKENNLPIFDANREKEIIDRQLSKVPEELKEEYLEFYTSLITVSKKYQEKIIKLAN